MTYNGFVSSDQWGRDHKTTIMYAETRVVDYGGRLDGRHMRQDGVQYPTILSEGQLEGHNDYDCLRDAEHEGLLFYDPTTFTVELTDDGWEYAGKLRRERAEHTRKARF